MKKLLFLTLMAFSTFAQTIVKTENGEIEGYTNQGLRIFKGIPFAAPPVGEFRWKAPQPVKSWEGIKKCIAFGASPMQASPVPFMCWSEEFLIPKEPISEDCLYLNVWSGAKSNKEKRPVFVYIYGGGFRSGGAACPIYDGEAMAKKGVIFVSINYRVGVFGFLAHPELSKESSHNASGNYALMDMIAALKWVQKNIEAFGGDAKNVTIAGQSAGAFGVNYLVASPLTKGLIHKAIAESGGSFYKNPLRPDVDMKGAEEMGVKYAKSLNCSNLAELRAKSSEEIQKYQGGLSSPIVDGYVMPEGIFEIFSQGKQNDIPTIVGWNEDDRVSGPPVKVEIFKEQMEKRFGDNTADFFKAYPAETEQQSVQSQMALGRDESFGVQDYTWAKMQVKTGKSRVFIYNFNRKLPAHTPETQFGAFHTGEVPYAYNNLHTVKRPWEAIDYKIADMMSSYWVNFAKMSNPNGKGLPVWETYQPVTEQVMIIDKLSGSKPLPSKVQMVFWEKYYSVKK
ncbi:MAG: carboxylesterase family protein [Bacteroidota bacterium]